ncbi:MAG: hypothetical protein WBJ82_03855 [Tepidanaerobacteraceae bacterium]|jgi:hypothetical protein|nr:hypothetical protein [Tepidanaerobacter sp.]
MKIVVCKNPEQLGLQAQAWPWMGPFPDEGSASLLDKEVLEKHCQQIA